MTQLVSVDNTAHYLRQQLILPGVDPALQIQNWIMACTLASALFSTFVLGKVKFYGEGM